MATVYVVRHRGMTRLMPEHLAQERKEQAITNIKSFDAAMDSKHWNRDAYGKQAADWNQAQLKKKYDAIVSGREKP